MGDPIDRPAMAQSELRFPVSWNDLRAFLAVSVHGSMNRAAEELGESQPTIGRRMRRLEQHSGLVLFQRGPNRILLTAAGEAMVKAIRPMADAEGQIRGVMAAFATRLEQPIRLTSTNSIAIFLSEHMETLRKAAAPRDVILIPTRNFVHVQRGEADLALRMRQVATEPGLLSRKVAVVAAGIYVRADQTDLPMITVPPSRMFSRYRELALQEAERRGKGPQIDELHLRLQAIKAGVGAGILPCWIGDSDPQLVCVSRRPDDFIREDMFLVRSQHSRHAPSIEAVSSAIVALTRKHRRQLAGASLPRKESSHGQPT